MKRFPVFAILLSVSMIGWAAPKKTNKATSSKKAASAKVELSAKDKEELKWATDKLSKLTPYRKGKLTRILNAGSKAQLLAFPGVGEKTVEEIIKNRPFESSAHLILVDGIGKKTYGAIIDSRE